MSTETRSTTNRLAHVETAIAANSAQITAVSAQMSDFVKESREDRERTWTAIKEQGAQTQAALERQAATMNAAIEKLSTKGQITWPVICSTLGVVLGLVTAGAGVNNALMEARIKQTEIRQEYLQRELARTPPR